MIAKILSVILINIFATMVMAETKRECLTEAVYGSMNLSKRSGGHDLQIG